MLYGNRLFSVPGYIVTQTYLMHIDAVKKGAYAQGVDLVPQKDSAYTPAYVMAHSAGTVIYAGDGDGYGNAVWIKHANGIVTGYGHMDNLRVKQGDIVSQYQILGDCASSGNSTGIHLHFEVRKYNKTFAKPSRDTFWSKDSFMNKEKFDWIDPTPYLNSPLPNQTSTIYRVQTGAYTFKVFAKNMYNKLKKDGYRPICKFYDKQYHIQVGAFNFKTNADNLAAELESKGYKTITTTKNGEDVSL